MRDWCHGNSVTMMPEDDVFYLSCRNMDAVFKISLLDTQEIIWRLGPDGDFAPDPLSDTPWFQRAHEPEIQPNGNILIYDNGGVVTDARGWSRVVEYAVDEETLEATIVWEFPGELENLDPWYTDEWHTRIWGDADRLPNGNTLVAAGTRIANQNSRIFEVTEDGRVVWELVFPRKGKKALGLYRAQRIADPPLVERI
jgi:hypothetical protein